MVQYQKTIWCDGCGVEITWIPLIENEFHYCCLECKQGLRCECGEFREEDYREDNAQAAVRVALHP